MNTVFYIASGLLLIWTGFTMLKWPVRPLYARVTTVVGFIVLWGFLRAPPYAVHELWFFYLTKPIAFVCALAAGIFVTKTQFRKT